jgi:hypothetical protein
MSGAADAGFAGVGSPPVWVSRSRPFEIAMAREAGRISNG